MSITSIVNHFETGPSSCGDGDIRLVGGECEREGRVEICYNGVWGTVCDYGWDQVDANTVCQQLGFCYQRALLTNNSRCMHTAGAICEGMMSTSTTVIKPQQPPLMPPQPTYHMIVPIHHMTLIHQLPL